MTWSRDKAPRTPRINPDENPMRSHDVPMFEELPSNKTERDIFADLRAIPLGVTAAKVARETTPDLTVPPHGSDRMIEQRTDK